MKVRALIVGLGLVAVAASFGPARADHCDTNILVLSGTGVLLDTGSTACNAGETGEEYALINPGSTSVIIRFENAGGIPIDFRSTFSFSGITSCPQRPSGTPLNPCQLKFTQAALPGGGSIWESQSIGINRTASINGGATTAFVCLEVINNVCTDSQTRSDHTAA